MPAKIDIVGQTFEYLLVLEDLGHGKVICKCTACGSVKEYYKKNVKDGSVKSCGCINKKAKPIPIVVGEKYYHWTVLEDVGDSKVRCQCDCENKTERILYKKALREGSSQSCGCKRGERCNATKAANGQAGYGDNISGSKYVGQKFGRLLVKNVKDGKFICDCDCGTKDFVVYGQHVLNGATKSCGCLKRELRKDWIGKQFGYLTVLDIDPDDNQKVICKCICEKEFSTYKVSLSRGSTRSCGCKSRELSRETMMSKYGDVCTLKTDNPRYKWQIDTINSKKKFADFLDKYDVKLRCFEVSKILGINEASVWRYLHKYELEDHIDLGYGRSKVEDDVYNFISKVTDNKIERHVRGLLEYNNQYELDIYIPDKKIAIEVNGDYWHSSEFKDELYHQLKSLECQKVGITLIHIFESEWINNRKQIQILLYNLISDSRNTVYARKCILDTNVSIQEIKEFENSYHLQGYASSSINVGLRYNNKLIALMTFGVSRFSSEYNYEVIRLCYDYHYNVQGGAEKMFKYFVNNYMKDNESVVSYCDISKFNGRVYSQIGFKLVDITQPGYFWVNNKYDVLQRYKVQKQKLLDQGYGNLGNTEYEIMRARGYYKVCNSGNKKFVYVKGVN